MEFQIKFAGVLMVALALLHAIFPKYFSWRTELASLSQINRQLMYVHTFFIGLILILIGTLCLIATEDLIGTKLGRNIRIGIGIFWLARLIVQFIGYSSELWRGKAFETLVHIGFSVLWFYFTVLFLLFT